MCEFAVSEWPRPEKLGGAQLLGSWPLAHCDALPRFAHSCSLAALSRRPSLRSAFAALSLRCAQPVASPRHSLRSVSLSRLGREPREPVWSRSFLDGTHGRTERRGPKGPPPTHVCLVRETRLLPPKAGRLASRSAKPTLDGSSLNTAPRAWASPPPLARTCVGLHKRAAPRARSTRPVVVCGHGGHSIALLPPFYLFQQRPPGGV